MVVYHLVVHSRPQMNSDPLHNSSHFHSLGINLLMSNVNYSGRTAQLTSKVAFYIFIQQI